jgi:peptide deformylase
MMSLNPKLLIYNQDDISILRKVAEPIANPSDRLEELHELALEMGKIMFNSKGIGLAAPQVGIGLQLFVMNHGHGLIAYANPAIIKTVGEFTSREGCLSFPGLQADIRRAKLIKLRAYDILKGKEVTAKYRGLESACAQHEIDHLNGIVCIDVNDG